MANRPAQGEGQTEIVRGEHVGIVERPAAARFPSMSEKSARLADQRERLVALAAAQRTALAHNIEPWRIPLARVDQGLAVLRVIKRNPAWIVVSGVLLAALLRGNSMKWLRRGWVAWQMLRGLRSR
ncbi:MAG: hypothetical protein COW07_00020 [Hydrogenophilales bacterium CG12_big_fil_rev_8_21_14_0_65_61_21]|nr:MAG: hypothetical protein COW07_00020 [Hydrogenophilales bacterium CG12_big_fil_rev_8_21_14_0_65_61_21]